MTDLNDAITNATAALSGPGSPEAVKATAQDDPKIIWVRALAGPALCVLIAGCIAILTWGQKLGIWTAATEASRAQYVGVVAIILTGLLGLVFWMIMPGRPSKLEIKAGPASVTLDGGPP